MTFKSYSAKFPGAVLEHPSITAKRKQTLENMIKRYGVEKGQHRWQIYCNRQAETNSFEYMSQQHGMTKKEFDQFNKNKIKKALRQTRINNNFNNGPKIKQPHERISEYKSFREFIMSEYNWTSDDYEYYKDENRIEANKFGNYSNISQELFWNIYEFLPPAKKDEALFAENYGEYKLVTNGRYYKFDFLLGDKIIEFDCKYWHDPEKDKFRDELTNSFGFTILRVNYIDYKENPLKVLRKCLNYLENEN